MYFQLGDSKWKWKLGMDMIRDALSLCLKAELQIIYFHFEQESVDRVMQLLQLPASIADRILLDSGATAISGGQRRRLGIGIELLSNPRILLLDEVR